ncbi:site-specific DNA-methyltransferase [Gordonia sp. p3-SID1431]|uniref:site-specific DNA-methyltransferase n=1 Tax=Gordonia sp. p3-SID1431 TaxID=2916159 RepID=UPI0021A69EFD|nr:site-specific DNA-methyltransferase [Gordonia sp. p3-SID1431]MCT1354495.1 site-specific DNA-methyltransferase [Gordonia sp. p3-SID1431]
MARKTPKGPTPIDSIKHGETRKNIPTVDAQDFVTPEIEAIREVRYQRDDTLDPQLVWRGKYPDDDKADNTDSDLVADAPPIYIQEKIDPRVLVENLRCTTARPEAEPELALFDTFDGLDELEQVDFYQHEAKWSNRMILGDSLQVMASLADRERLRGKVQMVYIDPPYGIKFGSNWQVSARNRTVRDGKLEDSAREAEQIKAFRDTWELGIHSYLGYLRDRLIASRDLLTSSGSCFVQIGDDNVHLVRSLMDEVYGADNFISLITVQKTGGAGSFAGGTTALAAVNDFIVWYARDAESMKYRQLFKVKGSADRTADAYRLIQQSDGTVRAATKEELVDPSSRLVQLTIMTSQTTRVGQTTVFPVELGGTTYLPSTGGWKTNREGMARLKAAKRLAPSGKTLRYVRYLDDFPATYLTNLWTDTWAGFGDDKSYVVQTDARIVERCMLMTTDPGDLVVDPTCGSGTTAVTAEQWGRRWITMDTSRVALALARQRVMGARFPWYLLADSEEGRRKEHELGPVDANRERVSNDIRHGFVYNRVPHIMLKSIANNPDIREGMSLGEAQAAIRRHGEFEPLFDRPFEDARKVRVAGPFTVESLSPHRALSFGDAPESMSERDAGREADGPNFEQSILENLAKAGIQNGKRAEKLKFETFETYAGQYIQAIGQQISNGEHASPSRIGIAIGPQYGTVSAKYVKDAAREAIRDGDVDLLCVLGFAFDPQVTNVTEEDGFTIEASDEGFAQIEGARNVGRLPVLMVRMNADLLMGEELKKTGSGNLFTVFGEPDIDLCSTDEGYIVDLKGVDIYDPTTGEIRSNDTGQIALWMIDTDYNEESFFVRHCYFTGGNDPYKRLKTALKADIDPDAWESLYKTVSRPFAKPSKGKIAVKVVNDYGDEVMKVFEV